MRLDKNIALRVGVHIAALLPFVFLVLDLLTNNLTANPFQAAEQRTGRVALAMLMLSLACTPVNTLFLAPSVLPLSKTLGRYAFLYASLHLLTYFLDYGLDWNLVFSSFLEKRFIFVGLLAFLILLAMAITSFQYWMKKLGPNWKRLHSLVYAAGVLVILHEAWALKGDIFLLRGNIVQPLLYGTALLVMLVLRLPPLRRRMTGFFAPSRSRR